MAPFVSGPDLFVLEIRIPGKGESPATVVWFPVDDIPVIRKYYAKVQRVVDPDRRFRRDPDSNK
jgi:hypothetical protein